MASQSLVWLHRSLRKQFQQRKKKRGGTSAEQIHTNAPYAQEFKIKEQISTNLLSNNRNTLCMTVRWTGSK